MVDEKMLVRIRGLHTVDSLAKTLNMSRQSALNLVSRLKKEGYIETSGGGRQKRFYKITTTRQRPRQEGLFDIINRHSPMKVVPLYEHQVHGRYSEEDALIDALETKNFRVILAGLRLFGHIKNWKKLYELALKKESWPKVYALYELSKQFIRVRKMPAKYRHCRAAGWMAVTQLKTKNFPELSEKYKVYIPFSRKDMEEIR